MLNKRKNEEQNKEKKDGKGKEEKYGEKEERKILTCLFLLSLWVKYHLNRPSRRKRDSRGSECQKISHFY